MVGLDTSIYAVMLVLFIIFMPKGIVGTLQDRWMRRFAGASVSAVAPTEGRTP